MEEIHFGVLVASSAFVLGYMAKQANPYYMPELLLQAGGTILVLLLCLGLATHDLDQFYYGMGQKAAYGDIVANYTCIPNAQYRASDGQPVNLSQYFEYWAVGG